MANMTKIQSKLFHSGNFGNDMFGNDGPKQGYSFICQIVKM